MRGVRKEQGGLACICVDDNSLVTRAAVSGDENGQQTLRCRKRKMIVHMPLESGDTNRRSGRQVKPPAVFSPTQPIIPFHWGDGLFVERFFVVFLQTYAWAGQLI